MTTETKKHAFIKLMVLNDIPVEIRESLEENGEQVNYIILGTEDGGVYTEVHKVLIHQDSDIDLVMDEVSYKIKEYLDLKHIMLRQTVLN